MTNIILVTVWLMFVGRMWVPFIVGHEYKILLHMFAEIHIYACIYIERMRE